MQPLQRWELRRQLVHLSGVIYLILAQFAGQLTSAIAFLLVALIFFTYGQFIQRRAAAQHTALHRFESRLRSMVMSFEHQRHAPLLFQGIIWYYLSSGIALALFPWRPLNIATAACLFLAVGDSFSTLVGVHGSHRIAGEKTWEGSSTFFVSTLVAGAFLLPLWLAAFGAAVATLTELLPAALPARGAWRKVWDDNLLIPLISGAAMTVAAAFIVL